MTSPLEATSAVVRAAARSLGVSSDGMQVRIAPLKGPTAYLIRPWNGLPSTLVVSEALVAPAVAGEPHEGLAWVVGHELAHVRHRRWHYGFWPRAACAALSLAFILALATVGLEWSSFTALVGGLGFFVVLLGIQRLAAEVHADWVATHALGTAVGAHAVLTALLARNQALRTDDWRARLRYSKAGNDRTDIRHLPLTVRRTVAAWAAH